VTSEFHQNTLGTDIPGEAEAIGSTASPIDICSDLHPY